MPFQLHFERSRWDDHDEREKQVGAYFESLELVQHLFPAGAYAIASDRRWYGFDGYGPHDAGLVKVVIADFHPPDSDPDIEEKPSHTGLSIFLTGSGIREIRYLNVIRYDLAIGSPEGTCHGNWMYDEFVLSGNHEFAHIIEWNNGAKWIIHAREIEVIR
jgi:hypothetical protein